MGNGSTSLGGSALAHHSIKLLIEVVGTGVSAEKDSQNLSRSFEKIQFPVLWNETKEPIRREHEVKACLRGPSGDISRIRLSNYR
jgi:hypothetical protein